MPELSPLGALVRRADPDRFLCLLFAPPARREALFALTAYDRELARAFAATGNPHLALIRVQWWREAVEEAASGTAPPRAHEVAGPLHAAIREGALDAADLLAMADASEAEADAPFPSRGSFRAWLRGTAGGWSVAAGRSLGAPDAALPALAEAGAAYGLARVLRATRALAARDRCLLPEDALAEAGLTADEVVREPDRAAPVVARLAAGGVAAAKEARGTLRETLPRTAAAAALPVILALRDLAQPDGDPTAPRGFGERAAVTIAGLRGRP